MLEYRSGKPADFLLLRLSAYKCLNLCVGSGKLLTSPEINFKSR